MRQGGWESDWNSKIFGTYYDQMAVGFFFLYFNIIRLFQEYILLNVWKGEEWNENIIIVCFVYASVCMIVCMLVHACVHA